MNDREYLLRKAILQCLKASEPYMVYGSVLESEVGLKVRRLRPSEFADALHEAESAGHITSVEADRGPQYKINTNGKAWLIEQIAG